MRNGTTHQIGCNAPYKYISISFLAEQLANEMWQADGTLKTIRHSPSLLSIAEPCVQHPEKLTSHTFGRRSSLKLALGQREATHLTVKEFRLSVASCSACPPTSEFRRVARHIHPSIPLIVIENPASCPDRRGDFPATHWPHNKSVDVWVAGCPAPSTPCTRKYKCALTSDSAQNAFSSSRRPACRLSVSDCTLEWNSDVLAAGVPLPIA